MVSTAAYYARVRGSVPGLGGLKETKLFLPHPRVKVSIVGSLRDREVACSASDRQGSNFESCVWRTVSSQSSHHPREVLLAQFSLYVHKGGLKPDSFHFISNFKIVNIVYTLEVVGRGSEKQLRVGKNNMKCSSFRMTIVSTVIQAILIKHGTYMYLSQYCINVCPTSQMVGQRQLNQYWVNISCLLLLIQWWRNVETMLTQH